MAFLLIILSLIFASDKNEDKSNLVKVNVIQSDNNYDKDIYLLFQLNIKDHWHTYWRNPGDSGLPTKIEIETKDNVKVSETIWPEIPEKIPFDDMANFGFSDQQNIILKLTTDKTEKVLDLKAKVSWLVCKEECIPQDTTISLKIPYHMDEIVKREGESNRDIINKFLEKQPKEKEIDILSAKIDGDYVVLKTKDKFFDNKTHQLSFFPFEGGYYSNAVEPLVNESNNSYTIKLKLDDYKIDNPTNINGLFVFSSEDNREAIVVNIPIN